MIFHVSQAGVATARPNGTVVALMGSGTDTQRGRPLSWWLPVTVRS